MADTASTRYRAELVSSLREMADAIERCEEDKAISVHCFVHSLPVFDRTFGPVATDYKMTGHTTVVSTLPAIGKLVSDFLRQNQSKG